MGSKSKPTIGYWYKMLLHFGLTRGPIDALLEFRGGERAAWAGVATGGTLAINARELWGGEKAEGGIEGELDVMLGGADQMPSARLAALLGDMQSAFRGRASVAFEGLYGAFNPYPKAASFKVRRIFEGWDGGECWYPEKAAIVLGGQAGTSTEQIIRSSVSGGSGVIPNLIFKDTSLFVSGDKALPRYTEFRVEPTFPAFGNISYPRRIFVRKESDDSIVWDSGWCGISSDQASLNALLLAEGRSDLAGSLSGSLTKAEVVDTGLVPLTVNGLKWEGYQAHFLDARPAGLSLNLGIYDPGSDDSRSFGMNPAHIIYDALTAMEMQGEPTASIDAASFMAAADTFYAESFGLCARFNPATQTAEDFTQRICSIAGATLSRSRVDGKYYLTPRRGVHDLGSLPILEDDDILEYEEEPSDPLEAVNQVTIEWFDPVKKQKRTTAPIQALGAIQALGGVVAESLSYPEIPMEALALRVGDRDLAQKSTPLKRFRLTTNRVPYAWRLGDYFRLQAPRRGIADMVCEIGEIDAGTPRSGSMRLVAIQDVSRMAESVYVAPEPGVDNSPSQAPGVSPAQNLIEAPFIDLAGELTAAELGALSVDSGFVLAMASRPENGINYTLFTAAGGEELSDRGLGDWCPTALVSEAGEQDPEQTSFTLLEGSALDLLEVGSAALWGDEIVRVDAIDTVSLAVTLGRGCGDTTPRLHAAGERIWFYDAWAASDRREYASGETVSAKLRTRTSSQLLDAVLAPTLTVELSERAARPYPPGGLLVNSERFPEVISGPLVLEWAHRDRTLQADQLIDHLDADIGPEAGTTYTVRLYGEDGTLLRTEAGISGASYTWSSEATDAALPGGRLNAQVRVELEAVRDGLISWQGYDLIIQRAGEVGGGGVPGGSLAILGSFPTGVEVGTEVSAQLSASGLAGAEAWALVSPPAGASITGTGLLKFTAAAEGPYTLTVKLIDYPSMAEVTRVFNTTAANTLSTDPEPTGALPGGYAFVRYVANGLAGESVAFPPSAGSWWVGRTTLPKGLTAADQQIPIIAGYPTVAGTSSWEIPAEVYGEDLSYAPAGAVQILPEPAFTVWNPEDRDVTGYLVGFRDGPAPYLSIEGVGAAGSIGSTIRALNGYTTGKHYWEIQLEAVPDGFYAFSLGLDGSRFGAGENGNVMVQPFTQFNDAGVWGYSLMVRPSGALQAAVTGLGSPGFTTSLQMVPGSVIRFAFDADAGALWIGIGGTWLGGGNPATGTLPTLSSIELEAGSFWPDFRPVAFLTDGVRVLANFGSQAWVAGGPPAGFSGCAYTRNTIGAVQVWDTDTVSVDAVAGVPGLYMQQYGGSTPSAHRELGITAFFNLIVSQDEPHSVLASQPKLTGRLQFEVELGNGYTTRTYAGLAPFDWDNSARPRPGWTADSFGFRFGSGGTTLGTDPGEIYSGGVDVGDMPLCTAGDVITFDCDLDAGEVTLYRNGALVDTFTLPTTGKPWVPVAAGAAYTTVKLISRDLTYPQAGASNWNPVDAADVVYGLTTEAGDPLTTEAGDRLTTE